MTQYHVNRQTHVPDYIFVCTIRKARRRPASMPACQRPLLDATRNADYA